MATQDDGTLYGVLVKWAEQTPKAVFLRDLPSGECLTYAQSLRIADYIAERLEAYRSKQDPSTPPLLALCLTHNQPIHILAPFACWKIGWSAGYTAANSASPWDIFSAQIRCLTPSLIVTDDQIDETIVFPPSLAQEDVNAPILTLAEFLGQTALKAAEKVSMAQLAELRPSLDSICLVERHEEEEAYRMFTSGATSASAVKAVSMPHRFLRQSIDYWQAKAGIELVNKHTA